MGTVKDWVEVGSRVREARVAAGLSQGQLADRMGLERTMLAKVESGDRRLDALELYRLSDVLALPIAHFVVEMSPSVVARRTSLAEDTATGAGRDAYLLDARLLEWQRDVEQLRELGTLVPRKPALLSGRDADEARRAAVLVRGRLRNQKDPLGPMADVCEALGVYLLSADIRGDGASASAGDFAVALVSSGGDPGRRRASAAHELGHQVLGDDYSADVGLHVSRDAREAVIDAFAAELLVPTTVVESEFQSVVEGGDSRRTAAVRLAAAYRVSWSLVLRQLSHTGKIDHPTMLRWEARPPTKVELLASAGYEPVPDLEAGTVAPSFARAVAVAYERRLITAARALELLRGRYTEEDLPTLRDDDDD
jgi:transcriptional regulator with XRE-family HTH domain